MSIVDRILSLFKSSNGTSTSHRNPEAASASEQVSPYKIHTAVKIEGMAFSADLKTFYLIDAGRLITFPLDTPSGLIIGSLLGRLTFAAQLRKEPIELADDGTPEMAFMKAATQSFAAAPEAEAVSVAQTRFELSFDRSPVWAPHYLEGEKVIAIIGMGDLIGVYEDNPDGERPVPSVLPISTKDNIIKIFRRDNDLLLTSQRGRLGSDSDGKGGNTDL